jgi:hypothetical protein
MAAGTPIESIKKLGRRCPRLGCPVLWGYCRREAGGRPCFKIFDCWWEIFDVQNYLRGDMDDSEFQRLCAARPPAKIAGLLELVDQVKKI